MSSTVDSLPRILTLEYTDELPMKHWGTPSIFMQEKYFRGKSPRPAQARKSFGYDWQLGSGTGILPVNGAPRSRNMGETPMPQNASRTFSEFAASSSRPLTNRSCAVQLGGFPVGLAGTLRFLLLS
jgi:hypothetical protein